MGTNDKIEKLNQSISRNEAKLAREKIKARKLDTRNKIEYGGLVIKSGMGDYSKSTILGALIDAREALESNPDQQAVYKSKGDASFMNFKEDSNE